MFLRNCRIEAVFRQGDNLDRSRLSAAGTCRLRTMGYRRRVPCDARTASRPLSLHYCLLRPLWAMCRDGNPVHRPIPHCWTTRKLPTGVGISVNRLHIPRVLGPRLRLVLPVWRAHIFRFHKTCHCEGQFKRMEPWCHNTADCRKPPFLDRGLLIASLAIPLHGPRRCSPFTQSMKPFSMPVTRTTPLMPPPSNIRCGWYPRGFPVGEI